MLGISFRNRCGIRASRFAELARRAECAGFEHLIFTEWYNDLIAYLVAAAATTQHARLWTGVANVGLRHPVLMASGAAVVDDVSGGRFVLGLGTGNEWYADERFDTLSSRPLGLMREYVAVLRAALRNEPVHHPGPRYPVTGARMSFEPVRKDLPIYLAALGPRMAELAAEISDGVYVHAHGPEDLPAVRERIGAGCERVSRDPGKCNLSALLMLCVDDDADAALETVREALAGYLAYDSYQRHISRLGYASVLTQMNALLGQGDIRGAARFVPDELVERVAAYGSVTTCRKRIADYFAAGANVVILSPRPVAQSDRRATDPVLWDAMYERMIDQFGPATGD